MKFLKETAWKASLFILWYPCTWFAKYDKPFWLGCVIAFVFFLMLDLIRYGLQDRKYDKELEKEDRHENTLSATEN